MKYSTRLFLPLICLCLLFVGCSSNSTPSYDNTPTVTISQAQNALWEEVYERITDQFSLDGIELESYGFTSIEEDGNYYIICGYYTMNTFGETGPTYGFSGKVHKTTGTATVKTIFGVAP